MNKIILVAISLSFLCISACDHTKQAQDEFLERANTFWKHAVSNNCSQLEEMVRYPVLMDGMSIDDGKELHGRCNAIYTSFKYLKEEKGLSPETSNFSVHESGWLKQEVLETHPLLKTHTGNDVSFFLLEVISDGSNGRPITFIFRRDYEDGDGDWDIIMLEDYSLTEKINRN